MGCDIHLYIEYKKPESDNWRSFAGPINPGRDYEVFGRMAGVRESGPPLVEPRGIPATLSWKAEWDWWLTIDENSEDKEGFTSMERALEYIKYGASVLTDKYYKLTHVEHPDWHTASWLSCDEFKDALNPELYPDSYQQPDPSYFAVLGAMEAFKVQGYDTRIVFWFDN